MLNNIVSDVSFFGLALTVIAYLSAMALYKKFKLPILNPLMVSCVFIVAVLLLADIDYNVFQFGKIKADGSHDGTGAVMLQNLLTPATICLAIPLYEKFVYLKKYPVAIIGSIFAGCVSCLISILLMSKVFGLSYTQYVTLLPKSITTAVGMGLSEELGGIASITVASIIITGIFGSIIAQTIFRIFRIKHPVAVGVACGTSAHAIGTAKARDFGEVQEAMSGLAIAVAGMITVGLASVFSMIKW